MRSATSSSGTSNLGSWVSTQMTVRSSVVDARPGTGAASRSRPRRRRGTGPWSRRPAWRRRRSPGSRGTCPPWPRRRRSRSRRTPASAAAARTTGRRPTARRAGARRPGRTGGRRSGPARACRARRRRRPGPAGRPSRACPRPRLVLGRGPFARLTAGLAPDVTPDPPGADWPGPSITVATATGCSARTAAAISPSSAKCFLLTGSTKMSMIPPQVRPTAKASSSLMP